MTLTATRWFSPGWLVLCSEVALLVRRVANDSDFVPRIVSNFSASTVPRSARWSFSYEL
jgi:hypothetical protein